MTQDKAKAENLRNKTYRRSKRFEINKPVIGDYLDTDCPGKGCDEEGIMKLKKIVYTFQCRKCKTITKVVLE